MKTFFAGICTLLVAALTMSTACFAQPQISGFTYVGELNHHRYYVSQYEANWSAADSICRSLGGHLACIGSQEENDFLSAYLLPNLLTAWIGLTDAEEEGVFRWVSGDPVVYTHWASWEPDNFGNQDCGMIAGDMWGDEHCEFNIPFVLEIDSPCPPSSLPFVDNFDSPTLDSCWSWIREDTSHWSLTERPGWMRIWTENGCWCGCAELARNTIVRPRPDSNFTIETRVAFNPTEAYHEAGLMVYKDDSHYAVLHRTYSWSGNEQSPQKIAFQGCGGSPNMLVYANDTLLTLKLIVNGTTALAYWSPDGNSWTSVGEFGFGWLADAGVKIGVFANNAWPSSAPTISADFDNFRVDSYPLSNLIVSPTALDFGTLDFRTDSVMSISLFNPTAQAIAILSVTHAVSAFVVDTTGLNAAVQPHSTYQMHVAFAPTAIGIYEDTLVIVATQPDSVIRIPLSGQADILLPPVDSLVIKRGTGNAMQLNWAEITHTISGRPFTPPYYTIYGATSPGGPFVPIDASPTNSYTHAQFSLQPIFFYCVTAATEGTMNDKR